MKKSLLITLGTILLSSFSTTIAQVVDDFYPVNENYATGYYDGNGKHDGDIDLTYPNVGWAVFDISSLPAGIQIQSIKFYGYIINASFPKWSSTPMGIVNPIVDPGTEIYTQILTGYDQNTAYIYQDDWSTFTFGWYNWDMGNGAVPDFQAAVNSSQGWFAIGFIVRDFSAGNFLIVAGHTGINPPYLEVTYQATPVELTSFNAGVNGNQISLKWQTATETNNKGFEVERRALNLSEGWENIGFVKGSGTTTVPKLYSFTDNSLLPGKYSYRLKQIDFDGTSAYSKEVEVDVKVPSTFSLLQNYPNPFNPATNIEYQIPDREFVTLKIYDVLGNEVAALVNEEKPAGNYAVKFNGINLSSGVYFYRLKAGSYTSTKKLILMK